MSIITENRRKRPSENLPSIKGRLKTFIIRFECIIRFE
ncbi:hypothetical protein NEIFL0001_1102 [Neisseria flavescens SK114]|nr:hypothetical protein NEIFL0001_1102 [Neisseria flavescens SK114]